MSNQMNDTDYNATNIRYKYNTKVKAIINVLVYLDNSI